MRKILTVVAALALALAFTSATAKASGVSIDGFSLGPSTGGAAFEPDFEGLTGSLGVRFCDSAACSNTGTGVTGNIFETGTSTAVGTYNVDFNSTPFLANFAGAGLWDFAGGSTTNYSVNAGVAGGITGTVTWATLTESGGVDSLQGTATFLSTGALAGIIGNGSASFTLDLNPLSCSNLAPNTPCTLEGVSTDPPAPEAFGTFGQGTFGGGGGPSPTPEPGTLLLLGSGLLGFALVIRRKFARA